ncbi:MAG: hypothetical protein ACI4AM_08410 [Muribaculaceae bacterium]
MSDQMPRQMIATLSLNWLVVMLVMVVVMLMPAIFSRHLMPALIALIAIGLARFYGKNRPAIARCVVKSLAITAVIMVVINLLNYLGWVDNHLSNPDIPYITGLILFTTIAPVAVFIYIRHRRARWPVHSLFKLCADEDHLQIFILAAVSAALAIGQWLYYYNVYINVNFNNRDWFLFNLAPLIICLASIPAMFVRYFRINRSITAVYVGAKNKAIVRVFLIADNRTVLAPDKFGSMDTPYSFTAENPGQQDVIDYLRSRSIACDETRYLFTGVTCDGLSPIHLYVAFVPALPADAKSYSLADILGPLRCNISVEMAFEVTVVKVISIACRTYHIDGSPRYQLEQYHTSFCLNDLRIPNIDYNDARWIQIARRHDRRFSRRLLNTLANIFTLNRL